LLTLWHASWHQPQLTSARHARDCHQDGTPPGATEVPLQGSEYCLNGERGSHDEAFGKRVSKLSAPHTVLPTARLDRHGSLVHVETLQPLEYSRVGFPRRKSRMNGRPTWKPETHSTSPCDCEPKAPHHGIGRRGLTRALRQCQQLTTPLQDDCSSLKRAQSGSHPIGT
jgi:hypothetical protein